MKKFFRSIIVVLLIFPILPVMAGSAILFANKQTTWQIRHERNTEPAVKYAVQELKNALKKISGIDFPVTTFPQNSEIVVKVDSSLGDPDIVSVKTKDGKLFLTGGSPSSVLYSVYSFLQNELGIRWLWPGKSGEFIPRKSSWILPELNYIYKPALKYRGFHLCSHWRDVEDFRIWMARNFINIHRHGQARFNKLGFHFMISDHNVKLSPHLIQKYPEYFAEIKGKHYVSQPCFSNRDVDDIIFQHFCRMVEKNSGLEILSIFPPDNMDYCQCVKCKEQGTSNAWFNFYNRLTDRLKVKFPTLKFATIAYQGYIEVPTIQIRNSEFIEYATYARCNIHTYNGSCNRNQHLLSELKKWDKMNVPIGNYGYEFDIFTDNHMFLPFFTMLEDSIKTGVKLNHTAIITEVMLTPKSGPEVQAFAVKNRLPLYLYARLLWNPKTNIKNLLSDWCKTIYGDAAETMYNYFAMLDQHWNQIKQHQTILGSPVETAKNFITPELQIQADKLFAKAAKELKSQKNPYIEREKELFNQWFALLNFDSEVILPLLKKTATFEKESTTIPSVGIRMAWTADAILFGNIIPPCHIVINNGIGGETWHFEIKEDGRKNAWRISSVGIRDDRWNPIWNSESGLIKIPFISLQKTPLANETWRFWIKQREVRYPAKEMASLRFTSSSQGNRSIIWWNGLLEKEDKINQIQSEFTRLGWQFISTAENLQLQEKTPLVYWFRHPNGKQKIIPENWARIKRNIQNGAIGVFVSYSQMPLEKYFADPTLKIKIKGIKNLPLSARRARYLAPGNWYATPHNLTWHIKNWITPAYGIEPAFPNAWKIIAKMDLDGKQSGTTIPFILVRKYGKGIIFVLGDSIAAQPAKLLDNLYSNRNVLLEAEK